jgi:hypothetical protein
MNTPNLHSLLSAITIGQLKAYLAKDGWKESVADGRLNFAKEVEPEELQTIFVPADRTHPKFRSLLQNLMFSLAVVQKREPAEIAIDISTFQIPNVHDAVDLGQHLHDIAVLIRGLAQECNPTEQAKGKILELARFLLASQSFAISLTPKVAEELWQVTRSDKSYLPAATSEWLEANARKIPTT